jgi:hypothetical protein
MSADCKKEMLSSISELTRRRGEAANNTSGHLLKHEHCEQTH